MDTCGLDADGAGGDGEVTMEICGLEAGGMGAACVLCVDLAGSRAGTKAGPKGLACDVAEAACTWDAAGAGGQVHQVAVDGCSRCPFQPVGAGGRFPQRQCDFCVLGAGRVGPKAAGGGLVEDAAAVNTSGLGTDEATCNGCLGVAMHAVAAAAVAMATTARTNKIVLTPWRWTWGRGEAGTSVDATRGWFSGLTSVVLAGYAVSGPGSVAVGLTSAGQGGGGGGSNTPGDWDGMAGPPGCG